MFKPIAFLIRAFQGAALESSKMLEMLSRAGFQGAALDSFSTEGIPDIAFADCLTMPIAFPTQTPALILWVFFSGYGRSINFRLL